MKQVILIAGASTGFGAITARALAHAGRPQVEAVECFGSSHFSLFFVIS
jgi:NADP-dependent 3-hydroxy acid dehydrogenase YdfG